ncbi:MAG TPA: PA14 domain-containing protein [Verrucomicrobiae bacterium]|nr:PA14 domain-containing protein [Verrucomicrobiae bacterium]
MNPKIPGKLAVLMSVLLTFCATQTLRSANILFVSDNPDPGTDNTFYPPIVGFPDDFYVVMLQNAGHNVLRFNPPNSQNTLLTAAQLAAINTNDLIIVSRSINSPGFQAPQSSNWNARVTKPLIMTSPYLVRQDGNRLFWFVGGNGVLPDTTPPTRLRGPNVANVKTAYLFSDIVMSGDTMVNSYDEAYLFNTSTISNAPTAGGTSLAQATFVARGSTTVNTCNLIAEFPAGTAVPAAAGGSLGGYRMFVAAGSREGNGVTIPLGAGADNLTPEGERIFMRAVELALNNGVPPITYAGPVVFDPPPSNVTVVEGTPVTFSVGATGALPRLIEWSRDIGDATTFTNIPGASAQLGKAQVSLSKPTMADNGAWFRLIGSNSFGMVTSVVQLTVQADTTPPTITALNAKWTLTNIYVTFSEPVDPQSATDPLNYQLDNGLFINTLSLDSAGTTLTITTTPQTPGYIYNLVVNGVLDRAASPNMIAQDTTLSFTAWVETRGFLISELFTNITTGNAVSMLTSHAKYPNNPDISSYVNVSSNAPTSPNLEQYGGRLVGWLVAPTDGNYTFYIRGDDDTELRLGSSADPATATVVANRAGANGTFQQSNPQTRTLTGGQAYFIEALWKEGTGGDYMQAAWTPPWSTNVEAIPGTYLQQYASPVGASVTITADPQGATLEEYRTVTFSAAATTTPANALRAYQWQKSDGSGGFTNALGVQNTATFTTPLLRYPDDNGSQWRVIVSVPGASATSQVATLTVNQDVSPPVAVSAGSIDGLRVGVCFNEVVESSTALDAYNYGITPDGGSAGNIISVVLRPDRTSVLITLDAPISGPFTVHVSGILDLANNLSADFDLPSAVVGLIGAELGSNARVGEEWTCDPSIFEVIGGGADIFGTADTGRFDSRTITGDFDARVRVRDLTLTGTASGPNTAKAGLMLRATAATDSPTIWLLGNAPPPGRDLIEPGYRATAAGATTVWANNITTIHMPDMWVRLARAGNTVTEYASSNNVDWVTVGSTNTTLPQTALLGVAVTAHNNVAGLASTGRFSNFSISQPLADLAVSQTASRAAAAVGSSVTYTVTVANNGPNAANLVTVTDPIVAGMTHVSSSASQGSCALASGVVTCNLGSIASGSSATITLVATMNTAGAKVNAATVVSSTSDPVAGNNSASATVNGFTPPQISSPSYDSTRGMFSVSVQTVTGASYMLLYKNDLSDPDWNPLPGVDPFPGNGSVQALTDPGPLPPKRFYKVGIQ